MRMVRGKTPSAELMGYLGIEGIGEVLCMGRLSWFEDVERMGVDN